MSERTRFWVADGVPRVEIVEVNGGQVVHSSNPKPDGVEYISQADFDRLVIERDASLASFVADRLATQRAVWDAAAKELAAECGTSIPDGPLRTMFISSVLGPRPGDDN